MKKFFVLLIVCVGAVAQPTAWKSVGVGGGGALFLPNFYGNTLTVACDMSQEFVTTNYGTSWSQVHFKQLQTSNNRGLLQYSTQNTIWTIDATSLNGSDTYRPTKSTDGGVTFHVLANDPTSASAYYLYANPNNAQHAIVADYKNIYSTKDGGATWKTIYTTNNPGGAYIAGVCFEDQNMLIALNSGILTSQNNGDSFSRKNISGLDSTKQAIYAFTWYKDNNTYRYFAVVSNNGDVYGGVTALDRPGFIGVFTVTSTGNAWSNVTTGIDASAQPYFIGANQFGEVFVAGGSSQSVPIVYKTTDNGSTWKNVFITTGNQNIATGWSGQGGDRAWSYGELALGFAVDYKSHAAAFTDYGFVHVTTDGGASWKQAYVTSATQNTGVTPKGKSYESVGLENTTCWHVVWLDSLNMYACFSDIQGCRSTDGGKTWSFNYTGHSDNSLYYVVKHPTTNIVYGATSTVHDMYQSTYLQDARIDNGKGKVLFSANNGAAWQTLHDFQHPVVWLALDPTQPNRMYASVIHSTQGGVYVTNNLDAGAGSTWRKLTTPPRTEGHPFNIKVLNDGTLVATFSGRRNSSGQFTASSGVFVWNGTTWQDRSDAGTNYWTKDIVIDPNDATQSTWYVGVFSGWGGAPNGKGGLYRTTNRGTAWTKVNTLDRVTSLSFASSNTKQAYLTTETDGLWFTNDITATNPTFTLVQSYPFRQPERVYTNPYNTNDVWVTSFGNGMKHSATQTTTPVPDKVVLESPANGTKNPVTSVVFTWKPAANATKYVITITDSAGRILIQDTITGKTTAGPYTLKFGKYHWSVKALNETGVGDSSDTWNFEQIPDETGVYDVTTTQPSVQPIPARDAVTITLANPSNTELSVTVFTMQGKKVLTTMAGINATEVRVDVTALVRGVYTVQISNTQSILYTQQIVIE